MSGTPDVSNTRHRRPTVKHSGKRGIHTEKAIREIRISFDEAPDNAPSNVVIYYANGTSVEALEIESWPLNWDTPPHNFTEYETAFASRRGLGLVVNVAIAGGQR